jgi:hypothetical protein
MYCLFSLSLRVWRVKYLGVMNSKRPTAIKSTINHAKTSLITEIFSGAISSVVQYLALLRYTTKQSHLKGYDQLGISEQNIMQERPSLHEKQLKDSRLCRLLDVLKSLLAGYDCVRSEHAIGGP